VVCLQLQVVHLPEIRQLTLLNELVALITFMSSTPNQLKLLDNIIWMDSEFRKLLKHLVALQKSFAGCKNQLAAME
jgi:hypothetical protein